MPRKSKGIYYLGRVIKGGLLDQDRFISSLFDPMPIKSHKHAWTIIETKIVDTEDEEIIFVYGKLIKYSPDAEIKVVEPALHTEKTIREENMSVASASFVYIPAHSGIAFLHSARHIPQFIFRRRFEEVIKQTNDNFFVNCNIEPIADLQSFAAKLERLDGIYEIDAAIFPPNPLFGPLWKSLKDYMDDREIGTMEIKEEAKGEKSLNTNLPEHVARVASQDENNAYLPPEPLPLGDAAILMAADGYGTGTIRGRQEEKVVVISTSETIRNFLFDREPDPEKLFEEANKVFEEIKNKRHLRH